MGHQRNIVLSWLKALLLLTIPAVLIAIFILHQYLFRPPFAGTFMVFGWVNNRQFSIDKNLHVCLDYYNAVVLVSPDPPRWIPANLVGDKLRIIRMTDSEEKLIDWRRNCLISLDGDGNSTFTSISSSVFFDPRNGADYWKKFFEMQRQSAATSRPAI